MHFNKSSAWGIFILSLGLFFAFRLSSPRLPEESSPVFIYSNQCGDDLHLTFTKAIRRAKSSVFLLVYGLSDPSILQALRDQAENGVDVQVIVDHKASKKAAQGIGPPVSVTLRRSQGLVHPKVLIVDNKEVWLGSANMTTESLRNHGNLVLGIHSPQLALHAWSIWKTWHPSDPQKHPSHPFYLSLPQQKLTFWQLPSPEALRELCYLIQTAKKSIYISQFTWTHPQITKAVIAAHKRGVDVRVVMDLTSSRGSSRKTSNALASAGVPVRTHGVLSLNHHKFAVIDDHTLILGSANWTRSAFEKNDDFYFSLTPLTSPQLWKLRRLWRTLWIEGQPIRLKD